MTNNLYNRFRCAILLTGMLSLPFFSFSQQEEPKRVTVVVTAKEVTVQKEIVQLPADNAPTKVGKAAVKKMAATTKNTNTPTERPKAVVSATPKAKSQNKEEAKLAQQKPLATDAKKPIEKPIDQKPATALAKTAPVTAQTGVSKNTEQVNHTTTTKVKDKNENEEAENISYTSTTNSFSYIWIGAFLIIAGVVLGLLFGKPAFLISFVGIVFVALGVLI